VEIQELREEQRQEFKAEKLIYKTEDNYLSDKMAECLTDRNYSEAVNYLRLRLELRKQNPKVKRYAVTPGSLMREAIRIFCYFPETDSAFSLFRTFPLVVGAFRFRKKLLDIFFS